MEEENLANPNNGDPLLDQKPSIVSHKENLMEKSKELLKTNQHSHKPND